MSVLLYEHQFDKCKKLLTEIVKISKKLLLCFVVRLWDTRRSCCRFSSCFFFFFFFFSYYFSLRYPRFHIVPDKNTVIVAHLIWWKCDTNWSRLPCRFCNLKMLPAIKSFTVFGKHMFATNPIFLHCGVDLSVEVNNPALPYECTFSNNMG